MDSNKKQKPPLTEVQLVAKKHHYAVRLIYGTPTDKNYEIKHTEQGRPLGDQVTLQLIRMNCQRLARDAGVPFVDKTILPNNDTPDDKVLRVITAQVARNIIALGDTSIQPKLCKIGGIYGAKIKIGKPNAYPEYCIEVTEKGTFKATRLSVMGAADLGWYETVQQAAGAILRTAEKNGGLM